MGLTAVTGDIQLVDNNGLSITEGRRVSRMGERTSMGDATSGEDMWRGNELSPSPTSHIVIPAPSISGEAMTLVGESDNDILGGSGVQKVVIDYLDSSGERQLIEKNMNGTTGVALPTDITFINDFYSSLTDHGVVAVKNIFIHSTADSGLVYDMIYKGGNKSLVPHYMVPSGHKLILEGWAYTEAQGKRCVFRIRADCSPDGVLQRGTFLFKANGMVKQDASGSEPLFDEIPAGATVKVSAWPDQSGAEGSCRWWGRLVAV
ncbi:MAG: hypothetical protein GY749_22800 [Desulfobacteraceae bacterium]|nr:hypothetical protein [Desulfobacteraceae bacterium]